MMVLDFLVNQALVFGKRVNLVLLQANTNINCQRTGWNAISVWKGLCFQQQQVWKKIWP